MAEEKLIPVKVALRIRPLISKEVREGCQECLEVVDGRQQVVIRGSEKAFTYDYAFSPETSQASLYSSAVEPVVQNLFKGYNVTILAYGQTGSGKTYSMGTCDLDSEEEEENIGVISRAVKDIFKTIAETPGFEFLVKVSFVELYKEALYDLLSLKSRTECIIDIREDSKGSVLVQGVTEVVVATPEDTLRCLERGALNRATGATAMNARSSRSHAIFTLHIEQRKIDEESSLTCGKFHLVDLAGSERAKKTRATGERLKEGININRGLLALGNVISALGDDGGKGHIPYRDSKLTRLLQDSLGGNSYTVMIACASPADSNLEETMSTLRYADRARKIKNKPIVNRDPHSAELNKLKSQIQQLQVQLLASNTGTSGVTATSENDVKALLSQNKYLEEEIDRLTRALQCAIDENTNMAEKALMAELGRDRLKTKLQELNSQGNTTIEALNKTSELHSTPQFQERLNLIKDLQQKIIDIQSEHQKTERAIMDHELSRHTVTVTTSFNENDAITNMQDIQDTSQGSPTKSDYGAAYTLRQFKLNEELQELNKALALKEELMYKMNDDDPRLMKLKLSYEKNIQDLESQVTLVSKEKDELVQQLQCAVQHPAANKVAEQRRKRVQELESQISELRKKIMEQNRLLKMKAQSEQMASKLSSEIQLMKAARVKLIRQMKEDNEKSRVWRLKKDREVAKLKHEDRKKQFHIVKMERIHSKQQHVFKRKLEEAVAINKRLKDAVAVQKAAAEKRALSRDVGNVTNRVKTWLEGELEVILIKKKAKQSLQELIEERKSISDQIYKLKKQMENGGLTLDMLNDIKQKRASLEIELQLRTAHISDLQGKIVEEDTDIADKKRVESIQSMIEAKCAIQYLFGIASEYQYIAAIKENDIKEIQGLYEEIELQLNELEKKSHVEITNMAREHEEKILFLLKQMAGTQLSPSKFNSNVAEQLLEQRFKLQEEEINKFCSLHDELLKKSEECEELKRQLSSVNNNSFAVPQVILTKSTVKTPSRVKEVRRSRVSEVNQFHDSSDDTFSDEDLKRFDPDWKKTPLFKKIRRMTRGKKNSGDEITLVTSSSTIDIKCSCRKDCSTKQCKCHKNRSVCGTYCKCSAIKCLNKSFTEKSENSDTVLDSSFDVTTQQLGVNKAKKRRAEQDDYEKMSLSEADEIFTAPEKIKKQARESIMSPSMF